MNILIKGLIVSLITIIVVSFMFVVDCVAVAVEDLGVASDLCAFSYVSNEAIKLETGYDEEVEKVIANKLIKSNSNVFIFDIDETVLNNSIGQSIYNKYGEHTYNIQWVCKDRLKLGLKHPNLVVKKYIKRAIKELIRNNKKVYFVTNTEEIFSDEVTETISKLLDIENPQILYKSRVCNIESEWKYKRFKEIAKRENVKIEDIVFTGDDIKDFPDWNIDNFGTRYFLVPQGMYGIQYTYPKKYKEYIEKEVK